MAQHSEDTAVLVLSHGNTEESDGNSSVYKILLVKSKKLSKQLVHCSGSLPNKLLISFMVASLAIARYREWCMYSSDELFQRSREGYFDFYFPSCEGLWRGALMFTLICSWINGWANNREAGDLRHHHAHYDVTAMGGKIPLHACVVMVIMLTAGPHTVHTKTATGIVTYYCQKIMLTLINTLVTGSMKQMMFQPGNDWSW